MEKYTKFYATQETPYLICNVIGHELGRYFGAVNWDIYLYIRVSIIIRSMNWISASSVGLECNGYITFKNYTLIHISHVLNPTA